MPTIQLFLQFEGNRRIELIQLDSGAPAREILAAAVHAGLPQGHVEGSHAFGPDDEKPLDLDAPLNKQAVRDKDRVHVHRCAQIQVTLHFNELTELMHFPPAATVEHVKKRFVHAIHMSPVDATEHVLQLCDSEDRPEPDTQIGSLVSGTCSLCFNLVPIKRIEG